MSEPATIEQLQKRLSKWDKILHGLKIALGFYAFFVLTYLAVQGIVAQHQITVVLKKVDDTTAQVRQSQLANNANGNANHEKTRQYIKCLFTAVLTVPIADRTNVDFDTCTKAAAASDSTNSMSSSDSSPSVAPTATPQATVNQSTPTEPKTTEPVGAAPPDPKPPTDDRSPLGRLPLVGGLLNAIGL